MLPFVLAGPWILLAIVVLMDSPPRSKGGGKRRVSGVGQLRKCFLESDRGSFVNVHGLPYTGAAFVRRAPEQPMLAFEYSDFPFNRFLVLELLKDGKTVGRVVDKLEPDFVPTDYRELKRLSAEAAKDFGVPNESAFAQCTRFEADYGGGGG